MAEALFGDDGPNQRWADLCRDWAALAASGLTVTQALRQAAVAAAPELRRLCEAVCARAEAGMPLSQAFAQSGPALPAALVPILEVGEREGHWQRGLLALGAAFQQAARGEERVAYSVLNPGFIAPLMLCGSLIPAAFFLQDARVFALYGAGCMVASVAVWLNRHRLAARNPHPRRFASRAASPAFSLRPTRQGVANRSLATMRWTRTLAVLLRAGVPISQALEVSAETARSPRYAAALRRAADLTRQGMALSDCLAETRLLPRELLDVVRTGETGGDTEGMLEQFACLLEDDGKMLRAQTFTIYHLLPAIILGMAVALAGILGPVAAAAFAVVALGFVHLVFGIATTGDAYLGFGPRGWLRDWREKQEKPKTPDKLPGIGR